MLGSMTVELRWTAVGKHQSRCGTVCAMLHCMCKGLKGQL